jgi:hypothetical protein
MSPVRYKLGFYIPEDDILHSHRRENLKSYTVPDRFNYTCDLASIHIKAKETAVAVTSLSCC